MNLLPSTLIFLPSLLVAVPMPLDQEGSTYIRGYNYKVSDTRIAQSNMSHKNRLQIPRSDGSRINFSRYHNSPGFPQPVTPPLDAVVVEAKVFVKVVTYICPSQYMYLSSCGMYFSPPPKSKPSESRRFWTMLNIGLICKTPFMSPVAEIENDASYWTELPNWIGLVLYHLIYAGTSNSSNQDMV